MAPTIGEQETISASIIVGITGKRNLQGKDQAVRQAISKIFDELGRRYPTTQKVLLTALAEGADRIAAEEAASREHWTTVAVLPLEPDLYCQDFDTKESVAAFYAHLAGPLTRVVILPTLMEENGSAAYEVSALQRRPGASNPARTLHYEQVGLYIANAATVLIAVMPGNEQPDRVGGTARIAKYRENGWLDEAARNVVLRSRILPPTAPLDMVRAGQYWLVDLNALSTEQSREAPAYIVRDGSREQSRRAGTGLGLSLADGIDRFNRLAVSISVGEAAPIASDAAQYLRHIRSLVSRIQGRNAERTRRAAFGLSCLFVMAVTAWEFFVEHDHVSGGKAGIAFYVFFIAAAILLYLVARRLLWQPFAEDYRAVAEALRVQIAWWEAGLEGAEHRVDNYYLDRALGSLGLVRAAVRAMINSALFASPPPRPVQDSENVWIGGQIRFFCERIDQRRLRLVLVELGSWSLFLSSLGAAAFLLSVTAWDTYFERFRAIGLSPALFAIAGAGGVTFVLLALLRPRLLMSSSNQSKPLLMPWTSISALLIGLVLAAAMFYLPQTPDTGVAWAGIVLIVSVTIAGAIRYVAEKLSWEVELRGYEDALDAFQTAKAVLADVAASDMSAEAKRARRKELIFLLGRKALAENESWLRAHRERPLEPVY